MTASQLDLVTEWRFRTPIETVWAVLEDVDAWPQWWPSVKAVQVLAQGDAQGVGAVRRMSWGTALPYGLSFEMTATRMQKPSLMEGLATGELQGRGLWTLTEAGEETLVRYDWRVEVTKPWMRRLAPLLRPVFAWNHGVVMERGRIGLARRLAQT